MLKHAQLYFIPSRGELPMECIDSGLVLLKEETVDVLGKVLNYAYGQSVPGAIPLL